MKTTTILVTGGAGYIGSHTVKALQHRGYDLVVLDNLMYGHREIVEDVLGANLIVGDIYDRSLLEKIFLTYPISAVVHLAGYAYMSQSVKNPIQYYWNNVMGTLNLLKAMMAASVKNIVFASTCAIYGTPHFIPLVEEHPQYPLDAYGTSKLVVEKMLADFNLAYGLKSAIFRYSNGAGADSSGLLGEDHFPETHLIPQVLLTALNDRQPVVISGTDYPTEDGSYVRDYIHVSDIAEAQVLGLEYLLQEQQSQIFNLGNDRGFSVKQVIELAKVVTGKQIRTQQGERLPEEPAVIIASSVKAKTILGWQPRYPDLVTMLVHGWNWHLKRHGIEKSMAISAIYSGSKTTQIPTDLSLNSISLPTVSLGTATGADR